MHLELKCGAYKPVGDEADISLACDRARFACNSIKKHYDRTLRLYDKSLEDKFHLKQYIVNNIDTAIENNYIKVYYQPIVSTIDGRICGLEALARWQDPNYGLLSPGAFIEILEEYRQIYKLDKYIIEAVCRDYRDSVDNDRPFFPVSLNFSRLDFELCDIVGYLCETVERYNVPKNFIDIEITESALTDQKDFLPNAIKELRSYGYKVWLDDFGSGYSSLNVLKDYQFDVLKIDMKFLSGFRNNEKTRPILENIVNLTKQLKMVSLTEGVETKEQFDFLGTIGCERAQGYLFSKPVPLEELRERIASGELSVNTDTKSA
ncbi:EAL domain-containing protein [Ruminococcus flavefaciens]|uniref:EAL domain-containing protein n=1 Tax=Ruminococcus flavefaciens TaxID=1265 RepID=UPI0026F24AAD|nr:EAL domain-containing protein [Ruminococcus flavefaciens]MDD7516039.1 EAL domain-containing protein [Ruminococcus flavefaciens]MDY5692776.1 EAL domain-containing protein [Ruminococcus flavefaciens]